MAMLGQTPACTPDIVCHHPLFFFLMELVLVFLFKFSCLQVGNTFVHQYYHIFHQSPQHVHRFYQEISKLGRPEDNGTMSITSTLQVSLLTYFYILEVQWKSVAEYECVCM